MENTENTVVLARVSTEMEAELALAALSDAGISAVKTPAAPEGQPFTGVLSLPGVYGAAPVLGYDIVVSAENAEKGADILTGTGCLRSEEAEAAEAPESGDPSTPEGDDAKPSDTDEALPPRKGSVLAIILLLVLITLFVLGVDKLIAWGLSLFK